MCRVPPAIDRLELAAQIVSENVRHHQNYDHGHDKKRNLPFPMCRAQTEYCLEWEQARGKNEQRRECPGDESAPLHRPVEKGLVNVREAADDPVILLAAQPAADER